MLLLDNEDDDGFSQNVPSDDGVHDSGDSRVPQLVRPVSTHCVWLVVTPTPYRPVEYATAVSPSLCTWSISNFLTHSHLCDNHKGFHSTDH